MLINNTLLVHLYRTIFTSQYKFTGGGGYLSPVMLDDYYLGQLKPPGINKIGNDVSRLVLIARYAGSPKLLIHFIQRQLYFI